MNRGTKNGENTKYEKQIKKEMVIATISQIIPH